MSGKIMHAKAEYSSAVRSKKLIKQAYVELIQKDVRRSVISIFPPA